MSILAYIVRHGSTDMSPAPEWQSQIPLNELGRAQALDAAWWLKLKQSTLPTWGVSSDLARAEETLAICAKVLNLEVVKPVEGLRALDRDEPAEKFETRNKRAFTAILATGKVKGAIPLIACHRSNTAWLSTAFAGVQQHINYRMTSAVYEGGMLVIKNGVLRPIYKSLAENPNENLDPNDGTPVSGFVTAAVNKPPRDCGHCKWFDTNHCEHPVVTADDLLGLWYGYKRNAAGKWIVEESACCNSFQHKVPTTEGGA